MRLVRHRADSIDVRPHPRRIRIAAVGVHEYITPLADSECDHVCLVGHNRNKVIGNDGHLMAVDRESHQRLGACVDQPEAIRLALLESENGDAGIGCAGYAGLCFRAVEVVFAVDEVVVRVWLGCWWRVVGFLGLDDREVAVVVPVGLTRVSEHVMSLCLFLLLAL